MHKEKVQNSKGEIIEVEVISEEESRRLLEQSRPRKIIGNYICVVHDFICKALKTMLILLWILARSFLIIYHTPL